MDQGKLQVGIWFMLPILGLLLLVVVLAGRGGVFVLVPAAALIGLGVLTAYFLMRGRAPVGFSTRLEYVKTA